MSSEAGITIFRATRPFFGQFIAAGAPVYSGVDARLAPFPQVTHYLSRGGSVRLSDRFYKTVAVDAEDFGTDDLFVSKGVQR